MRQIRVKERQHVFVDSAKYCSNVPDHTSTLILKPCIN